MTTSEIADLIAQQFKRQENTNTAYNNPGAIMDLEYYRQTGQFRLQQYPTYDAGYSALVDLIKRKGVESGLTLRQFLEGVPGGYPGYAPYGHGGNDPNVYAENVAGWLGINPDVPLNQAFASSSYSPSTNASSGSGGSGGSAIDWSLFGTGSNPGSTDEPSTGMNPYTLGFGALAIATVIYLYYS